MRDLDTIFAALAKSPFRQRFKLKAAERTYYGAKGRGVILEHAAKFVTERLSAAQPKNDGKQTPMRGHPVFIAQHATATCCRGCLAKWHAIPAGAELGEVERRHIVTAIARWLDTQMN